MGGRTGGAPKVPSLYSEQAAHIDLTSPMSVVLNTGSFTPTGTSVEIEIDVNHVMVESLGAWTKWRMYYGPHGVTPITPEHLNDALPAGVAKKPISGNSALQSSGMLAARLDGLTPGQQYDYEISASIVGGAGVVNNYAPFSVAPYTLAVSKTATAWPEQCAWGGVRFADGSFGVFHADHTRTFVDRFVAFFTATEMLNGGATIGWVDVTPDGTRIVCGNQQDNSITVLTTGAGSDGAVRPKVQGRYALDDIPKGVACTPDNTYVYVALSGTSNGRVQRVNIVTGTVDASFTIAGAPGWAQDVAVSPDGTILYVCHTAAAGTAPRVSKLQTSDHSVLGNHDLFGQTSGAGPGQLWCALSADGSELYVVSAGLQWIWKIDTSTLNQPANHSLPVAPTGIQVFPDGKSLLVSSTDPLGQQILQPRADNLEMWTSWPSKLGPQKLVAGTNNPAYDVAIGPYGAIYAPNYTQQYLNEWFGGYAFLYPDQSFYDNALTVLIRGAY